MEKKKHFCINCSLTKVHGNISAVYEYLVDHRFITDCDGMPDGMLPYDGSQIGAVAYAFRNGVRLEIDAENGEFFSASAPVNTDGDYIMLLVNANATDTAEEYGIARRALCAYVTTLSPAYPIVLHLDGWLADAFHENGEEHALPGGDNVEVVDSPYYGDRVKRIQENISIRRHETNIEPVIMEALGITREQAEFDHVFHPDTKCDFQGFDNEYALDKTYFNYRDKRLILFLTADEKGHQAIEIAQGAGARVKVDDIHDLKEVIDENFFEYRDSPAEPVETPAEPVETAKATDGKPTFASLMDDFTRRMEEIVSRTPEDEDWFVEFNETASPKEVVGYYLHTYGIANALKWWKKNSNDAKRSKFDEDVDEIFDTIFCPFCEQRKEMTFGSQYCFIRLTPNGTVDCYSGGNYQGAFKFPNCPQCGKPIETK